MLHIFGKIYLTTDEFIDHDCDKILISSVIGGSDSYSKYEEFTNSKILINEISLENVVGSSGVFKDFVDFFNFLFEEYKKTNRKIVINAEEKFFHNILWNWYKIILEDETFENVKKVVNLQIFNYKMFKENLITPKTYFVKNIDTKLPEKIEFIIDNSKIVNFIEKIKTEIGIEFILSSYCYNGSYKKELKDKIQVLYKKSLESYMYDLRELFLLNYMNDSFAEKVKLNHRYNFDNYEKVFDDGSETTEMLFKNQVWNSLVFKMPSTKGNILNFDEFNQNSVDALIKFIDQSELNLNIHKKCLLNYKILNDFTDEVLNQYIDSESTNQEPEPLVLNLSLGTVNTFLVKDILKKYTNNKTKLKNLVLKY